MIHKAPGLPPISGGLLILLLAAAGCGRESPERAAATQPEEFDEATVNSVWHQAKLRGVAFRALGQEPGWLLEMTNGEEILLVLDYGETRMTMPYVEPVVYQEEARSEFLIEAFDVSIEIRGERCRDTMSGEAFATTVTVRIEDRQLRGCGRALF